MYKEHPDFEAPQNEKATVWRYMSISKFLHVLETSALYFVRSDKFKDPFEGAIPDLTADKLENYFSELPNQKKLKNDIINLFRINRKLTLINCWYESEYESDAMWQLYSQEGIAVQSSFKKLSESFNNTEEGIHIGKVKYIDFNREGMLYLNALAPFLYKRISFQHENELRAVVWNVNEKANDNDNSNVIKIVPHGKQVRVDLDLLIENICQNGFQN